jgi:Fe2+ or Zn2+ uptake regulation protein
MPKSRRASTPVSRRSRAKRVPDVVADERVVRVDLGEDPHAHIVCRNCGRIQGIELTELERLTLTEIARHHPDGWSVDGIAFSATGACRRCREGPPV